MPVGDGKFKTVTSKHPCPICGHGGWCRVAVDGSVVMCRRVQDGGREKLDRSGVPYYIHRLGPGSGPLSAAPELAGAPSPEQAPVEVRAEVYAALLSRLTLATEHRAGLRGRGLPDTEIERRGYRSHPGRGRRDVARGLAYRFTEGVLLTVPGFVRKTWENTGKPYLTISGMTGLLIPVRDLTGRVTALLSRPDEPPDPDLKYLWITSKGAEGPGPGAPCHVPLPLAGGPDANGGIVAVYEGILKSDVAAALDPARLPAVGIPGAEGWRPAIQILKDMAPRVVRYYPDPDAWDPDPKKAAVGRALRAFWKHLKSEGFTPELGRFPDAETR